MLDVTSLIRHYAESVMKILGVLRQIFCHEVQHFDALQSIFHRHYRPWTSVYTAMQATVVTSGH